MPQARENMELQYDRHHAHSLHNHNDNVSRSKIPSRILRQESDSEDRVCETDVAQLQLQSFSGSMSVARHDSHG